MSPIDSGFDSPIDGAYAQSPIFEDAVVSVPYKVIAGGMVFRLAGCPWASMYGFDCSIVPDDADYGRLGYLSAHMVFVAESTVYEPTKCFLAKRPMLPCGRADHVATTEIGGTCVG